MSDTDAYILRFSPKVQQRLLCIRQTALDVFGNVEEKVYYGCPTIYVNGNGIMFYGAYKDHVSICVGYDWIDFLKGQFPQFRYTRATIKFQHKDSFPQEVVQAICELLKGGIHAEWSTTNGDAT